MSKATEQLVEIGERYMAGRKLFTLLVAAARKLKAPSFRVTGKSDADDYLAFDFAGCHYSLRYSCAWDAGTVVTRAVLSYSRIKGGPWSAAASITFDEDGAVWDGSGVYAKLNLPEDAAEAFAILLTATRPEG